MMKKVTIYSTPTCHYCQLAKQFFTEHNIAFEDFNVAVDAARRKEMVERSGQLGVPVIAIDGDIVVGFDQAKLGSLLGV